MSSSHDSAVSVPTPPVHTSLPWPPRRKSAPLPPLSVSSPSEPISWSSSAPPSSSSSPSPALMSSAPAQLEALAAFLGRGADASRPGLVCGDFNVCPRGLDSWNEAELAGAIFHSPRERERFQALLAVGFADLWRELHPDSQAFSWWDYRGGAFHRKQGLRIDFLLGTPTARSALRAAEIDRDWRKKREGLTPSDHAPVWADLA